MPKKKKTANARYIKQVKGKIVEVLKAEKKLELGLTKLKKDILTIPYHPECPDIPHIYR
jgi:hypothetical protein